MRKIGFYDIVGIAKKYFLGAKRLDKEMHNYFERGQKDSLFVNKGRTALRCLIEDFNLKDCEIILPSFICSDVFVPIFLEYNITPKLVDCEKGSLRMNISEIRKNITKNTKAIITVHVLGIPNYPREIRKICDDKKIIMIEDCAHCINLKYKGRYLGSYGDAAIFSFAKEMPNFIGGLYINNKRKIREEVKNRVGKYKVNKNDLMYLASKFRIYRLIFRLRKTFRKESFSGTPKLEEVYNVPKSGMAIFCYYCSKINLELKRNYAREIYNQVKLAKVDLPLNLEDINNFSAKSFPILTKQRADVLRRLYLLGINPGIGWNPNFSQNKIAISKWKIGSCKIANYYSLNLLTISMDEVSEKIDRIIKIIKQQNV